jgi:NTP pyrophosphatase (non-canonical NTP hydrolase)
MNINEYQAWVRLKWNKSSNQELTLRDDFIMTVGLAGETGEVMEILKKKVRDGSMYFDDKKKEHLIEELGDVFYYLTMICSRQDITLQQVIDTNVDKLNKRYADRR